MAVRVLQVGDFSLGSVIPMRDENPLLGRVVRRRFGSVLVNLSEQPGVSGDANRPKEVTFR